MGHLGDYNKDGSAAKAMEVVRCCVCEREPDPYALDYHGNLIGRCPDCAFRFVSPRARFDALLGNVYEDGYYDESAMGDAEAMDNADYIDRLSRFKLPPGLLLDVGTSSGWLLEAARRKGWDIEGTDIQKAQVELIRKRLGCPIHLGFIEDLDIRERYDAITFMHVLEHTLDPKRFLLKIKDMLKPGGVAYAMFPNTASLNDRVKSGMSRLRLKSKAWKHFAADHHLWFFTPTVVEKLCASIDFPVLHLGTVHPRRKRAGAAGPVLSGLAKAGLGSWIELALRKP